MKAADRAGDMVSFLRKGVVYFGRTAEPMSSTSRGRSERLPRGAPDDESPSATGEVSHLDAHLYAEQRALLNRMLEGLAEA